MIQKNILKLLITILIFTFATVSAWADMGRNQGAVNNLCPNLSRACSQGDKSSCQALREVGCKCDAKLNNCSRGNYAK